MKPKFITFTGIDLSTNFIELMDINKRYPVEYGILFSPTNKHKKYEFGNWQVEKGQGPYNIADMYLSAHLCGGYAREVLETGKSSLNLSVFKRVQINASTKDYSNSWGKICKFCEYNDSKTIILQHRAEFPSSISTGTPNNIVYLYDCSGGRGVVAEQFPKDPGYFVGFAGGFGPDNVKEQLAKINCKDYYIDMEGKVRTNNIFDTEKVRKVCMEVYG